MTNEQRDEMLVKVEELLAKNIQGRDLMLKLKLRLRLEQEADKLNLKYTDIQAMIRRKDAEKRPKLSDFNDIVAVLVNGKQVMLKDPIKI